MASIILRGINEMLEKLEKVINKPIVEELQCVRIGDLEFLGCPFEVMQAIKNDIHAAMKAPCPMLMSLCNGTAGYAPDNQQLQRDSYESYTVPLITRKLPFANIHNELLEYMKEIDAELFAD